VWWSKPGGGVAIRPVLAAGKLGGVLDVRWVWSDALHVEGEQFEALVRRMIIQALPVLVLREGCAALAVVLTYTLIFSLVSVLVRSPLAANGFGATLTFHLYASIPPLAVASVCAGLGLPYLDLSSTFVCTLAAYLVMTLAGMRRPEQNGTGTANDG
jgi:hypothetical protein